jgi:flagellum-specific ATP synthase
MRDVIDSDHQKAASQFRELLASYRDAEDLITLGAYAKGSNAMVDKAIDMIGKINLFLKQDMYERDTYNNIVTNLKGLFSREPSRASKADFRKRPFDQVKR